MYYFKYIKSQNIMMINIVLLQLYSQNIRTLLS